jgi:tetratricopeptide (TPR) repeat protein
MQASRRLAWVYESLGDYGRAREIHENNLRRARARGEAFIQAQSLATLAQHHLLARRIEPAIPLLEEAHQIYSARANTTDRFWDIIVVCWLARSLALGGDSNSAIQLLTCADAHFEELEVFQGKVERRLVQMNDETRRLIRQRMNEVSAADASEKGLRLSLDDAVELAVSILRSDEAKS